MMVVDGPGSENVTGIVGVCVWVCVVSMGMVSWWWEKR